jgi:hypothetical protein
LEIFPRKELVPMVYGKTRTNSATGGRSASSSFCKSHRGMKDAGRSLRSSVVLPEFSSFLMTKVLWSSYKDSSMPTRPESMLMR